MRSIDFAPLYRASVGFDRMMNLLDSVNRVDETGSAYPPYNIEKIGDDNYQITMAVAGFSESELEITVKENLLLITARKDKDAAKETNFLHRGIATRSFERRFDLADHIKVKSARLENGLLHIDLEREVPEALKPRTIAIESNAAGKQTVLENKAA